jgi:DNA-binding MarR family transcriptional regulator
MYYLPMSKKLSVASVPSESKSPQRMTDGGKKISTVVGLNNLADHDTPEKQDGLPEAASVFYQAETYTANESIGYLMRRILWFLAQGVERELEPSGLTNAQWVPLLKLHMGSASTVAELARTCELDPGSMTRLLDRLEAKGLCERTRSLEDRRVVNLELTESGRVAAKAIPDALSQVQNAYLQGFSVKEWQMFKKYLSRMLHNAQTVHAAAGNKLTGSASAEGDTGL